MRGALAVVTLSLFFGASCQDLHGVEVIVQPGNPAVASVRVFVGTGGATNSSLTTSSKVQVDDVEYWSRDANNQSDVVTGVDGTGEVKFLFGTSDTIPAVIAVGYDANQMPIAAGALTDLEVRSGGYTGYELPLIGPVAALGAQGATVQLGLWSPDLATSAYDAACAGIVVAGAAHPYFVVTGNDQDCDGLTDDDTAHECTPDVYLGTRGADPSEASCLVADHSTAGVAQCRLGGATCTDNVPRNQNTCVAGHTCTLNQICTQCATSFECAADIQTKIGLVDHYECTVARKADNSLCETTFALARPPTGGYGCKGLDIGDANSAFGTKLTVGNAELDATLQDSAVASCAGKLALHLSSDTPVDFTAAVAFALKNNAGIALPIHVISGTATTASCPDTTECPLVGALAMPVDQEAYQPPLTECAAAWGPVAPIQELVASNGTQPTLSADQLEMIFAANSTLYRTTRTAVGATWTPPLAIQFENFTIPMTAKLHAPQLAPNGVELFFALEDTMAGATTMFYATRASATAATWNMPSPVISTGGGFEVRSIAWGPGTKVIVGTANATSTAAIYEATWEVGTKMLSGFTMAVGGGEDPYLTADGMQLYYDAPVAGGGTSIYVASRRTPTEAFAPAVELVELSSSDSTDVGPWVPAGGHTIYFASERQGASAPTLYQAQRMSF